ncbi:MAG: DUF5688 family protein [Lachnospiraceae bacterium]|nr:DUF5688 family protein [Lachnospiraceae bacterium]
MLSYDEFLEYVKTHISEFLPEKFKSSKVDIIPVKKNNETVDGITIKPENVNIAPTIYLKDYFSSYENEDASLSIIMTRIATIFTDNAMTQSFDLDYIRDFENVSGRIVPKVVGIEDNDEYLSDKIYTVKADLAVTYAILLDSKDEGSQTIAITKEMADMWGTSAEVLEHTAKDNMETLMPYSFMGMTQVMIEMMGKENAEMMGVIPVDLEDQEMLEDEGMFVLTNQQKLNGAAELINEKAMDKVRETIQSDFYILPSSTHEVLCVKATDDMNVSTLEAMVQEVNATQVQPQDRLSDHVYKYDYARHELYRADQEKQRQEELQASQIRNGAGR